MVYDCMFDNLTCEYVLLNLCWGCRPLPTIFKISSVIIPIIFPLLFFSPCTIKVYKW